MPNAKRGEIYWVKLPEEKGEDDRVQAGVRPCIVVSRTGFNHTLVSVVPLTHTLRREEPSHRIRIPQSKITLASGGNPTQDSIALCDQVQTINSYQLEDHFETLSQDAINSVGLGLKFIFNLV
jgi:mRNA-degrading endonuclease toxin of MazEF toxin-antitoxin module